MQEQFDIYVRVSRTNGRSGERFISPDVQGEKCRAQAKADGRKVGKVFIDLDQSGGKASRPEFDKMMARIEEGASKGVYVYDLSRFGRSTRNVLDGIDLIEAHGGEFISCAEKIDTTTANGRFILTVFAALRQMEREQSAERWKTATDHAAGRGVFVGITPVGFDRRADGTLDRNEDAKIVREVFIRRISGWSWSKLAQYLEDAGVATATGKAEWHINSVRSLIQHPVYKGTIKNGIEHHFPEYAIVTPSEWSAAQARSDAPAKRDLGSWALLAGVIFCAECGGALTAARDTRKNVAGKSVEYRVYRCQNRTCMKKLGKHVRVKGGELDALIAEEALRQYALLVSQVGIGSDENTQRVTGLEQELAGAEFELSEFLLHTRASLPGFAEGVEKREAEVERIKSALTDERKKTKVYLTPEEARQVLDNGTLDEKREAIRRVLSSVTVSLTGTHITDEEAQKVAEDLSYEPPADAYVVSTALVDRVEVGWKS